MQLGRVGERKGQSERASGLLGAVFGVACVMAMLALVSNVALGLWIRSTVDAVAYDAARRVATAPPDADMEQRAQGSLEHARRSLGDYGRRVGLQFEELGDDDDVVTLHVVAPGTSLLPRMIDGGPTVGAIDRRIVLHREGR